MSQLALESQSQDATTYRSCVHIIHFEAVVFKSDWTPQVMVALRKGQAVEDFVEIVLKESVDDVLEILANETKGKPGATLVEIDGGKKDSDDSGPVELVSAEIILEKMKISFMESSASVEDTENKLPKWLKYAETIVRERVSLIVEAASETALIKSLTDVPAAGTSPPVVTAS